MGIEESKREFEEETKTREVMSRNQIYANIIVIPDDDADGNRIE